MKAKVIRDCINSKRQPLNGNTVVDIDEASEKKLFDLGLVEKYDEKKHGISANDKDAEIAELRTQIETLVGYVRVAITLPKGQVPEGFEDGE
jgi:hypothetical protein